MTNVIQIPQLPAAIALNGTEAFEAVQAGTSVQVSVAQIANYVIPLAPAPGSQAYPALSYESGALNTQYVYGDARRYGIFPGTGVNYEDTGQMDIWVFNCTLPGISGYLAPGYYRTGHNFRAIQSNSSLYIAPGAELAGIWHMIGRGTSAAATGTMSAGGLNTTAVTDQGTGYWAAPLIDVWSGGGGGPIHGCSVHAVMEANAIDTYWLRGTGFVPNEVITLPNSVQVTVNTVSAGGVIATATITARGSMTDPTAGTGIIGNLYPQISTTGIGSGAAFFIDFRLKSGASGIVIDSAGSGGTANVALLIDAPVLQSVHCKGLITCYSRLGVQFFKDCSVEAWWGKNNVALNVDSQGQPGIHIDGCGSTGGLEIGSIIMDDTIDGTGSNGWAAISIDGPSWRQARNVRIGSIYVKTCAVNAVAIDADVDIGYIRVDGFGRAATVTSTPYFGPTASGAESHGIYIYRGMGRIGYAQITQNDQTIGASATHHILVASTGLQNQSSTVPVFNIENNDAPLMQYNNRGFSFGWANCINVSRKGGFVLVDKDHPDSSSACDVTVDKVSIQYSQTTAMTSGYQGVANNTPGSAAQLRGTLTATDLVFLNGLTQDGFFSGSATYTRFGSMRFPYLGSGKQTQFNGIAIGKVYADSSTGGVTTSTNPIVTFTGADVEGSDVDLYANCTGQSFSRPVALLDTTTGLSFGLVSIQFRNADIVKFATSATRFNMKPSRITGNTGTENGINFQSAAFTDCHFQSVFVTACGGVGLAGVAPTFTRCSAVNATSTANGTNTQLTAAEFGTAVLNTTNWAP